MKILATSKEGTRHTHTSVGCGRIATVTVDVCMRPCDSVAGTRCTLYIYQTQLFFFPLSFFHTRTHPYEEYLPMDTRFIFHQSKHILTSNVDCNILFTTMNMSIVMPQESTTAPMCIYTLSPLNPASSDFDKISHFHRCS